MTTPVEGRALSAGLARLAAVPVEGRSRDDVVRAAVSLCHEVLGPAVEITVHLGRPDQPDVVVSTGRTAQVLDGTQLRAEEGPTSSAFREQSTIAAGDPHADPRWPGWARALSGAGIPVVAVVAVPLSLSGARAGVLTAYRVGGPVTDSFPHTVEPLALAVRALLQEAALREQLGRAADDLDRAVGSRAVIDQAKGVVMAQEGCTAEEAFQRLVDLASTRHVKLRDVAAAVVDGVARDAR